MGPPGYYQQAEDRIESLELRLRLMRNEKKSLKAKVTWLQAELDRLRILTTAIDALRRDEGDSVLLAADNPDFDGPNSVVSVCGAWCGFQERTFFGDSPADALAKAVKAREAAEKKEK